MDFAGDFPPSDPARQLAVVLCTRDRPERLRRGLDLLLERVPPGTEVIVVDSGSATDETARVADRPGVVFVRSDVPGLSIARNLGLSAATRPIVAYTDDDCAVAPGFAHALVDAFRDPSVGAAAGRLVDHSSSHGSAPGGSGSGEVTLLTGTVAGLDAGHGALMAFRRTLLARLGGFDPVLGAGRRHGGAEDLDAFCRVLHAGFAVARVPGAIVVHENTRDDDDYVRLSTAYGLGLGAMCGKWRTLDRAAARALTATVVRRAVVRSLRRLGAARTRRADAAFVRGLWTGMREARGIPVSGGVFVDASPPAPVRASAGVGAEETS